MAEVTRFNGDAKGVVNMDVAPMVATGLTKRPTAFKITAPDMAAESGVNRAVEAMLKVIAKKATVVLYQVDTTQLSVLVEATGWGTTDAAGVVVTTADADLTAALQAMTDLVSPAFDFSAVTAVSTAGFKLA